MVGFERQIEFVMLHNKIIGTAGAIHTWFTEQGHFLSGIPDDQWPGAQAKIEKEGSGAVKKFMTGDYFWHPECVKCKRCWKHTPECRDAKCCNRCIEAMGEK